MAKKKSRYSKADIKPSSKEASYEDLRQEFPKKLVDLFVKMHDSEYGEVEHNKYEKEAISFLKEHSEDKVELGKLIVKLTKATFDLVKNETESRTKKKVKVKKFSKSKRNCRGNGNEKEKEEKK